MKKDEHMSDKLEKVELDVLLQKTKPEDQFRVYTYALGCLLIDIKRLLQKISDK